MITDTLKNTIQFALKSLGITAPEERIELEHPAELSHGDYATNIAMHLAGEMSENPRELAERIVSELEKDLPEEIASVVVAGPGFINFRLSPAFFAQSLKEIIEAGGEFGNSGQLEGRKTIFEYTTQNLMKEFHVGHLMSHVIGNAISNIYAAQGAEVKRNSYQGDVGMHIAKVVWAIKTSPGEIFPSDKDTPAKKARYLGFMYAIGDAAYSRNDLSGFSIPGGKERLRNEIEKIKETINILDIDERKKQIENINKEIYGSDPSVDVREIYEKACRWSRESYQSIYDRLGVELDWQFFESDTAPVGKEIVEQGLAEGVFEENDGAIIYRGDEDQGLHTRVFINSAGIPTYEAKDIGLMKLKHEKYPYDEAIIFTANEQNEYFKVVLAAAGEVIPDLAAKNTHIGHGMLQLSEGKMSSRTGDVLAAEDLLDAVKERAEEKIAERLDGEVKEVTAEAVAQAAVRYSILKQDASSNVVFDTNQALSFEGNSGPYLQYTHARCQSLLSKAANEGLKADLTERPEEVSDIEKTLYRFPEVVKRSAREYTPHLIATYLHNLARDFNTFYGNTQIISDDKEAPYRLALTAATAQVLKNGLKLLSIQAPEEM